MRDKAAIFNDLAHLQTPDFEPGPTYGDGLERLYVLCAELRERGSDGEAVHAPFRMMERLEDADLGSPGSAVHLLESWRGSYEEELAASLRRKPTARTLWMVNRILNADPADAERWLGLLQTAAQNSSASDTAREEAAHYVEYQRNR